MGITIIKNPSDYNFSKSPVICEFETDNYILNGNFGFKAAGLFTVGGLAVVGNYIKINTTAVVLQLDFINSITPVVGKLRIKQAVQTFQSYLDDIFSDIILNTSLTSIFNITYDTYGGYFFIAINTGPQYTLIASSVVGSALSFINSVNGTDDLINAPRPGYKLQADVYVEKTATFPVNLPVFDLIYSASKEPFNNRVKFDISKIIDASLDYYFPIPNQINTVMCLQVCKKFFVVVREFFGQPVIEHFPSIIPALAIQSGTNKTYFSFALKAGFSPRWNRVLESNQLDGYIWSYQLFLTTKYNVSIKKSQPQYIFYCLDQDYSSNLQLRYDFLNEDNTTLTVFSGLYSGIKNKGCTVCFSVNSSSSPMNTQINLKNALSAEVSIVTVALPNTPIAGGLRYIIDYEPQGDDKIFLFTNSMGGVDTFRSTGGFENDIEFDKDVSNRIYNTDDLAHLGSSAQNQIHAQDLFKVYSGWKTQDDINWLEDLFLSKYVVEVINLLTYMPIIITSKKMRRHKTNDFLHAFEFEYFHQLKSPVSQNLQVYGL